MKLVPAPIDCVLHQAQVWAGVSVSIDETIDWRSDTNGVFRGDIDDSWAQGRSVFGGLVTSGALRAIRSRVPDRRPVELHTRYIAPLPPGPISCQIEILRAGGSVTHVEARVSSPRGLASIVSATLASPRESAIRIDGDRRRGGLPDPESLTSLPYIPNVTPAFLQHVDMRWTGGGAPFTGQAEARIEGWCRVANTRLSGADIAAALLDVWPTPVLPMLHRPAPASTISWNGWFHRIPEQGGGWWWYREAAHAAADGVAVSVGYLYSPDGSLAVSKGQSAAVYG